MRQSYASLDKWNLPVANASYQIILVHIEWFQSHVFLKQLFSRQERLTFKEPRFH